MSRTLCFIGLSSTPLPHPSPFHYFSQILRIASALAVLLQRPLHIDRIRAGRAKPGLRAQHLTGIELVARMVDARLEGGQVGSTELTLWPRQPLKAGAYTADAQTAGSTCLLLQVALPCVVYAPGPCELRLKGGTNAAMAPQIDYAQHILLPTLRRMGVTAELELHRRGYYPQGGGEVVLRSQPRREPLLAIDLTEFGTGVTEVHGVAYCSAKLPPHIAERMAGAARKVLRKQLPNARVQIDTVAEPPARGMGTGCGIVLAATTSTGCVLGGSALGERGRPAEDVGTAAAEELLTAANVGACVDEYLLDQLVIYAALAVRKKGQG